MISFEYSRRDGNNSVEKQQTIESLIILGEWRDMDNFISSFHSIQYRMVFNIVCVNKTDKNPCDNGLQF